MDLYRSEIELVVDELTNQGVFVALIEQSCLHVLFFFFFRGFNFFA